MAEDTVSDETATTQAVCLLFGGMTMEGKYVEGVGNVRISEEVISTIVAVAALEVKGVTALTPLPVADINGL